MKYERMLIERESPEEFGYGINPNWMANRTTSKGAATLPLLQLQGYDTVKQRGIYSLALPPRNQVDPESTRWLMQVGVRYTF